MSKNIPVDGDLYARVIAEAKKKFDLYPSAYANGWVVQEYKRRGGKYRVEKAEGGLSEWFREKWVDLSRPKAGGGFEPCGRPDADKGKYPKCVPASRAAKMTPEEIKSAVRRKRLAETTRRREGQKPINVPTIVKNDATEKATFGSRSEAGRYAANIRWQSAGNGFTPTVGGRQLAGGDLVRLRGTDYRIGLEEGVTDKISGAVQYRITSPNGKEGMLQVFPDGDARVIGLPSLKIDPATLVMSLQRVVPGVGLFTNAQYKDQIQRRLAKNFPDPLRDGSLDDAIALVTAQRTKSRGSFTTESVIDLMDGVNRAVSGQMPRVKTDIPELGTTASSAIATGKRQLAEIVAKTLNDPSLDPAQAAARINWEIIHQRSVFQTNRGVTAELLSAIPFMRVGKAFPKGGMPSQYATNPPSFEAYLKEYLQIAGGSAP